MNTTLNVTLNVTFDNNLDPEMCNGIIKHISTWQHVIPAWAQSLHIWSDPALESVCQITVNEPYRALTLALGPHWITESANHSKIILHELLHCYNVPLSSVALEAIEFISGGTTEPVVKIAEKMIRDALERCNNDLVGLIFEMEHARS